MKAKDIMTKNVITVKPDDTVEKVVKLLMDYNITGLPVVDQANHVLGIITEGDLIYRSNELKMPRYLAILDSYIFFENPNNLEKQIKKMIGYVVKDVMTEKVIAADVDDTIEELSKLMTNNKVNRLPILENGVLVGIVSRRDIIKSYSIRE